MGYSRTIINSVLKEVLPPKSRNISEVSQEYNISRTTISNWIKSSNNGNLKSDGIQSSPGSFAVKEKYQLVMEYASISEENKGAFLRMNGIHSEHLELWDQELRELVGNENNKSLEERRKLKKKVKRLEKDLIRKERALAEMATILTLKKKLDLYFQENEE